MVYRGWGLLNTPVNPINKHNNQGKQNSQKLIAYLAIKKVSGNSKSTALYRLKWLMWVRKFKHRVDGSKDFSIYVDANKYTIN